MQNGDLSCGAKEGQYNKCVEDKKEKFGNFVAMSWGTIRNNCKMDEPNWTVEAGGILYYKGKQYPAAEEIHSKFVSAIRSLQTAHPSWIAVKTKMTEMYSIRDDVLEIFSPHNFPPMANAALQQFPFGPFAPQQFPFGPFDPMQHQQQMAAMANFTRVENGGQLIQNGGIGRVESGGIGHQSIGSGGIGHMSGGAVHIDQSQHQHYHQSQPSQQQQDFQKNVLSRLDGLSQGQEEILRSTAKKPSPSTAQRRNAQNPTHYMECSN